MRQAIRIFHHFAHLNVVLLLIFFSQAVQCQPPARTACRVTYRINPSGEQLEAKFFKPDLLEAERAKLVRREDTKYGYGYRPTGEPATMNLNCAGYVLKRLFPVFQGGGVDVDDFYNKILVPYGETRWTACQDCVVLYRDVGGKPAHYALVWHDPQRRGLGIRSKDNDERPHIGPLPPLVNPGSIDALIQAYPGRTKYYWLPPGRITLQPVSNTCNDQAGDFYMRDLYSQRAAAVAACNFPRAAEISREILRRYPNASFAAEETVSLEGWARYQQSLDSMLAEIDARVRQGNGLTQADRQRLREAANGARSMPCLATRVVQARFDIEALEQRGIQTMTNEINAAVAACSYQRALDLTREMQQRYPNAQPPASVATLEGWIRYERSLDATLKALAAQARQSGGLAQADRQRLQQAADQVRAQPCLANRITGFLAQYPEAPGGGASAWAGTYIIGNTNTLVIEARGGSFIAKNSWHSNPSKPSDQYDVSSWTNCRVQGNTARCEVLDGHYHDAHKDMWYQADVDATLAGNQVITTSTIKGTVREQWHGGQKPYEVRKAGTVFGPGTFTRR